MPCRRSFGVAGLLLTVALASSCGEDGTPAGPLDATGIDVRLRNGCPILSEPQAMPGDPIGGDSWDTFARGFFEMYCTRCHSTTLVGDMERNDAPAGRDWDDEATVRMFLPEIRRWVGELNAMPVGDPKPSCEERQRLVQWIDAGAP